MFVSFKFSLLFKEIKKNGYDTNINFIKKLYSLYSNRKKVIQRERPV